MSTNPRKERRLQKVTESRFIHAAPPWIRLLFGALILAASGPVPAAADEVSSNRWPGWRGDGSGTSRMKHAPLHWNAEEGTAWRTRIPGGGVSSPVVWDDRVFLTAAVERGALRLVICLDAESGETMWQEKLPAETTPTYPRTGHAAPTPVTDGEHLFAFFDSPGLVALDFDGNVVWQVDLGPFVNPYNMAGSPVLAGDVVVISCDHQAASFIAAFDRKSGKELWRTDRDGGLHYATPLYFVHDDLPQLVVNAQKIVCYNATDGTPLWWCDGMKHATTPTAVYHGGRVYLTSGRNGPSKVIEPGGRGDISESHVIYHLPAGGPYIASPLVFNGLFIIPGDDGRLSIVGREGEVLHRQRVRSRFTASPIVASDRMYWCDERGVTHVFDLSGLSAENPRLPEVSVNPLSSEPCYSSPAAAGGRLYIRTDKHLHCIVGGEAKIAAPEHPDLPEEFEELKAYYLAQPSGEFDDTMLRLDILGKASGMEHPGVASLLGHMVHQDGHWDVCEAALRELGSHGEAAVPELCGMFDKGPAFFKTVAAEHLAEIRSPKAVPALLKGTTDGDLQVRITSISALGATAAANEEVGPAVAEILIALLEDEDGLVRKAAADSLNRTANNLGPKRDEVIDALNRLMHDKNKLVARSARQAIKKVSVPEHEEDEKHER